MSTSNGSNIGVIALEIALHTIVVSFAALTTALLYFDLRARELAPRASIGAQHAPHLDPASEPQP